MIREEDVKYGDVFIATKQMLWVGADIPVMFLRWVILPWMRGRPWFGLNLITYTVAAHDGFNTRRWERGAE